MVYAAARLCLQYYEIRAANFTLLPPVEPSSTWPLRAAVPSFEGKAKGCQEGRSANNQGLINTVMKFENGFELGPQMGTNEHDFQDVQSGVSKRRLQVWKQYQLTLTV